MKDVTEELRYRDSKFFQVEGVEICGLKIPRTIAIAAMNYGRKYEAESVRDIKQNYQRLLKCHLIPPHVAAWLIKNWSHINAVIDGEPNLENEIYPIARETIPLWSGVNFAQIFLVRLLDLEPKSYHGIGAIEFNIYDSFGEKMPGVFVYHNKFLSKLIPESREQKKSQLEILLLSTGADTFNLWFLAIDKRKKGKMMLLVGDIQKNKPENEETPEPPEESEGADYGVEGADYGAPKFYVPSLIF